MIRKWYCYFTAFMAAAMIMGSFPAAVPAAQTGRTVMGAEALKAERDGRKIAAAKKKNDSKTVKKVKINKSKATVSCGRTMALKVKITPKNASNKSVKWTTSNAKIATVTQKGVVEGIAPGKATVTATAMDGSKKKATCRVTVKMTVKRPVTSVALNKKSAVLDKGKSVTLKATAKPAKASFKAVRWSTSNAKVATVTQKGAVKAVGRGTCTITATAKDGSGKKAACKVTVKQPVTRVSLNKTSVTVEEGKTVKLVAAAAPANADNKSVKWTTSNAATAAVSQDGTVKGVSAGEAAITATAKDGSGKKATCKVTVKAKAEEKEDLEKPEAPGTEPGNTGQPDSPGTEQGNTDQPGEPVHEHVWKDVTETIHHDEEGHYESVQTGTKTIVDEEAWDEDEYKYMYKCSKCGELYEEPIDVARHIDYVHYDNGDFDASYSCNEVKVGTIHHDAITHEEPIYEDVWVVDREAWDETVIKEQKCQECGETRPAVPGHEHTWVDVTKTVHHDEKSHMETQQVGTKTVVDQEAWDEDVYKVITTCSECGYQSENGRDVAHHIADDHDGEASYSTEKVKVDTIHHDAVTHEEPVYEEIKVVDEEAWDETVVVGQRCPECGAAR